jgi:protein phosphatase
MNPDYLQFAHNNWYPEITGAMRSLFNFNADTFYPSSEAGKTNIPGLAIVCSGLSGMRGEGADISRIVNESIQEKILALFIDLHHSQQDITATSPELLIQSIETIFSDINQDIIQIHGTDKYKASVVLALYSPDSQIEHEIYLAHVGDCRAYWLTYESCHQLTLDDTYANLEISSGRSTHEEMLNHPFADIPIQLVGLPIDRFKLNLQRLRLQEDGVLMLCSRKLSINHFVEESLQTSMKDFFQGHVSFQDLAEAFLTLANEKNGQENNSIALMKLIR